MDASPESGARSVRGRHRVGAVAGGSARAPSPEAASTLGWKRLGLRPWSRLTADAALPLHSAGDRGASTPPVRVALTGASGYTGGRLLAALQARGDEVRCPRAPGLRHGPPARLGRRRLVEGELGDAAAAARGSWRAPTRSLHVAAVYRTAGHPDSYYREVNVGGHGAAPARRPRAAGVRRFVHTSTVGVHGHVEHPPADETAPIAPGDIYQATKAEAEALALGFQGASGACRVAVVRPGAIYGPGETRLLKLFRAIARGRYAIVGRRPDASTTPSTSTTSWRASCWPWSGPRPSGRPS